jgi:hypothetical protein
MKTAVLDALVRPVHACQRCSFGAHQDDCEQAGRDIDALSLEDWFDAARLRDDYRPNAFRGRDDAPVPVRGHEFGLQLTAAEKRALIAFLKTL